MSRPHQEPIHIVTAGRPTPGSPLERDRNGCLVERRTIGGREVVVHFDDLPEGDRDAVDGIPCTSAVRTIIDIGPRALRRRARPRHPGRPGPSALHPR